MFNLGNGCRCSLNIGRTQVKEYRRTQVKAGNICEAYSPRIALNKMKTSYQINLSENTYLKIKYLY
jgi:hypothetical protein